MLIHQEAGGCVCELQSHSPDFHFTPNHLPPLMTTLCSSLCCSRLVGGCAAVLFPESSIHLTEVLIHLKTEQCKLIWDRAKWSGYKVKQCLFCNGLSLLCSTRWSSTKKALLKECPQRGTVNCSSRRLYSEGSFIRGCKKWWCGK